MNDQRIICVKGTNSNWYEQAIFILRKNPERTTVPVDLVAEAERIVSGYYKSPPKQQLQRRVVKSNRVDFVMNMIMITCCIALAGVLLWNFLY